MSLFNAPSTRPEWADQRLARKCEITRRENSLIEELQIVQSKVDGKVKYASGGLGPVMDR